MTKTTSSETPPNPKAPAFLAELLAARSPSGYETEAREVIKKRVAKNADSFEVDALGSCHATLEGVSIMKSSGSSSSLAFFSSRLCSGF